MLRDEGIALTVKILTPTNIQPLDIRTLARRCQLQQVGWLPWMFSIFSEAADISKIQKTMFNMLNYPLDSKHHKTIWADLITFYGTLPDNENVLAKEIRSVFQTAFNCTIPTWRASGIYNTRYGQSFTREDFTVEQVACQMNKVLNAPQSRPQRRLASC